MGRRNGKAGAQEIVLTVEDPADLEEVKRTIEVFQAAGEQKLFRPLLQLSDVQLAMEIDPYRADYETLLCLVKALGDKVNVTLGLVDQPELTGKDTMTDFLVAMAPAEPAAGGRADNPRDVFGPILMARATQQLASPEDVPAALAELSTLFIRCRYASQAFKVIFWGLRSTNIAIFILMGRAVVAVKEKKARKGLAAAAATADLPQVQQATGTAVAVFKPMLRRSIKELAILARALTQKNRYIPDEFVAALSAVTISSNDDDHLLDVFVQYSYVLRDFYLWLFQQKVHFFVRFAQSWGLLGPAQFGGMWWSFRVLVQQTITVRLSNCDLLELAQSCGAIKEKGDGFTLAYARTQLAAEADVLQFFAPLTDVEAVLEGRMPRDNNNRYLVSTLAALECKTDELLRNQGRMLRSQERAAAQSDENMAYTKYLAARLLPQQSGIDLSALEADVRRHLVKSTGGQAHRVRSQASAEECLPVSAAELSELTTELAMLWV